MFSRIFSMCLQLLGASPAPGPRWSLLSPDPLFCPPSWQIPGYAPDGKQCRNLEGSCSVVLTGNITTCMDFANWTSDRLGHFTWISWILCLSLFRQTVQPFHRLLVQTVFFISLYECSVWKRNSYPFVYIFSV